VTSSEMLRRAIQAARLFDVPLHLVIEDPSPCARCEGTRVGSMRWGGGSAGNWIPEPCPDCCCEVCGDTTETAPLCARCDIAQDAAYERSQDV